MRRSVVLWLKCALISAETALHYILIESAPQRLERLSPKWGWCFENPRLACRQCKYWPVLTKGSVCGVEGETRMRDGLKAVTIGDPEWNQRERGCDKRSKRGFEYIYIKKKKSLQGHALFSFISSSFIEKLFIIKRPFYRLIKTTRRGFIPGCCAAPWTAARFNHAVPGSVPVRVPVHLTSFPFTVRFPAN